MGKSDSITDSVLTNNSLSPLRAAGFSSRSNPVAECHPVLPIPEKYSRRNEKTPWVPTQKGSSGVLRGAQSLLAAQLFVTWVPAVVCSLRSYPVSIGEISLDWLKLHKHAFL